MFRRVGFSPGRNYIPRPLPSSLAVRNFAGEGGGGVYFEAPRGRNCIRPPFLIYALHCGSWAILKITTLALDCCVEEVAGPRKSEVPMFGNGQSAVSESTVSSTELSECFGPRRVRGRELTDFLSAFACQSKLTEFFAELTEFAADLSEFSLLRQVQGYTGIMRAPSCELWRSLAKFGELWRSHNVIFRISSLTFTRVPAKVPHVHQSSGEGTFFMRLAFGMCPIFRDSALETVFLVKEQSR